MTFSEATKRQALELLQSRDIQPNEKLWNLPQDVLAAPPFEGLSDTDQLDLYNAVKLQLGKRQRDMHRQEAANGQAEKVREPLPSESVKSPFLFVPLNAAVQYADQRVGKGFDRSHPLAGGLSGSIEIEWIFETPLLIGQTISDQAFDKEQLEKHTKGKSLPPERLADVAIPMALGKGDFVVPGTTLKGAIRATLGIVTAARLGNVNDNHHYGLRDFDHPLFAGEGDTRPKRLTWDALGAGLLRLARDGDPPQEDGDSDYVIEPCDKRMVRMEDLIPFIWKTAHPAAPNSIGFKSWARHYRNWLKCDLEKKYKEAKTFHDRILDLSSPAEFRLSAANSESANYAVPVKSDGNRKGLFVFAGQSPMSESRKYKDHNKNEEENERVFEASLKDQLTGQDGSQKGGYRRQEYAFFPIENEKPVRVSKRAWKQFLLLNSLPGKTSFRATGSWEKLEPTVKSKRPIPVFHTGSLHDQENEANRLEIGLTRLFKIAHTFSVGDVIAKHHPAHLVPKTYDRDYQLDMVEALFGYVHTEEGGGVESISPADIAQKGRVSFGFAHLAEGQQARWGEHIYSAVMMGPRASFAPFYLAARRPGQPIDWSDSSSQLAGRKRYFPRYTVPARSHPGTATPTVIHPPAPPDNTSAAALSDMVFLEPVAGPEMRFRSSIRFHNVLPEEIGAVLWALTFGGECKPAKPFRHMIGRGKPFGAGQCRIGHINLSKLQGHDAAARASLSSAEAWEEEEEGCEGWVASDSNSLGPFLRAFDAMMTERLGADWANSPEIAGLLYASALNTGAQILHEGRGGYPTLTELRKIKNAVKLAGKAVNRGTPEKLLGTQKRAATRPYLKR